MLRWLNGGRSSLYSATEPKVALRRKISDPGIFKWGHLKNKDRQIRTFRERTKLYFFFLRDCINQGHCEIYWGMVQ